MRLRRRSTSKQGLVSSQDLDVTRHLTKRLKTKVTRTKNSCNRNFTANQLQILQAYFCKNDSLSRLDEPVLSKETGLNIPQIKRWFSRRRARARKTTYNKHTEKCFHPASDLLPSRLIAIPVSTTAASSSLPPNQASEPTTTKVLISPAVPSTSANQALESSITRKSRVPANATPCNLPPGRAVESKACINSAIISTNSGQWHIPQSSYDCCQNTLQLCDKLLQNMFGYDWIVKLRLHRHV